MSADPSVPASLQATSDIDGVVLRLTGRSTSVVRPMTWFELIGFWVLFTPLLMVLAVTEADPALTLPQAAVLVPLGVAAALWAHQRFVQVINPSFHASWVGGGLLTRELRVTAQGVRVDEVAITWQDLDKVELVAGRYPELELTARSTAQRPATVLRLPISEVPEADRDWLVSELRQRHDEGSALPEERERIRRQARALSQRRER